MRVPKDLLIGAAAAGQAEGNKRYSDDWTREHMEFPSFNEPVVTLFYQPQAAHASIKNTPRTFPRGVVLDSIVSD